MSRFLLISVLFTSFVSAAAPPSDDPWRYVDPTAKALIGIQWKKIYDSPAGQRFRQQVKDTVKITALPGMDMLSNVDTVLFSTTGLANPQPDQQSPVLIAVTGHFDLAKLKAQVSKSSRRAVVQSVEIFESVEKEQKSRMGIALVSPTLILVGDTPALVRAVGSAVSPESNVISRAKLLNEHNEFWAVTNISPANISGASLPLPIAPDEIRSLDMGMAIRDGLGLDMNLQTRSAEAAKKIRADLVKAIQMAARDKNATADLAGFDKVTKITTEKEYIKITVRMDPEELEKRVAAYKARSQQAVAMKTEPLQPKPAAGPAAGQAAVAAAPAQPAVKKKPVILNLDPDQ